MGSGHRTGPHWLTDSSVWWFVVPENCCAPNNLTVPLKFHRYQFLVPSPHIQDLLDHIDSSGDLIFWG
ncbi:DUF3024 domain-containing protein [Rhodococcus erythropolis]|uniref:DUF3024 domain-containing protein n=1 Tax=Rhodococcus erythropolis TaxID=1833 RepID=UPI002949421E|nr:DUF3024 domain-containing protein [Rhodococcus erythropolis]MDV6278422.1 DUF3024 domain-containing protein [Rhodococcus erythropolis]